MTPPPVPDRIHRAMLGHMTDINRLGGGQRLRVRKMLLQLGKDLAREVLESGLDTPRTDWQQARLRELIKAAEKAITGTFGRIADDHAEQMRGLVEISGDGLCTALNEAIGADLCLPVAWTKEQLEAIASDTLIQGAPSREWWSRQGADVSNAFQDQMRAGMLRGESLSQLRQRVIDPNTGLVMRSTRNAEALARTSVISTANEAHLALFEANADVMGGVQWMATLDNRTTPVCRALDGKQWTLPDYKPKGHSMAFPGATAHWCCRSTPTAVTKTWEELAKAAGGDTRLARELDKMPKGDRAAMGGPVSGDLTYEDWFKGQPQKRQAEILGPGRMALWQKGQLGFTDLVDDLGNPLTLEQLKARKY